MSPAEPWATAHVPASGDPEFAVDDALALADGRHGGGPADRPPSVPPAPTAPGTATGLPEERTGAAPSAEPAPAHRHTAASWPEARAAALRAARAVRRARPPAPRTAPLADALGSLLATPLAALADLPSFDTSAMDGWAVAGPGPWSVRGDGALAGRAAPAALEDGTAVPIATGARSPAGATAVLRSEHGRTDPQGRLHPTRTVTPGQDIRPRGQECRTGDRLLPAGTLVTPAVLGLAAAAGYDELPLLPRPTVEILILGDELLDHGLPHDGLIRDALGPMLTPWLRTLGADVVSVRRLHDDAAALREAVTGSTADVLVTTGGTAAGPEDHVRPVLLAAGAELLVDGVAVRPGHPMLLARMPADRLLLGLPGNPLAAVSGLLTLGEPVLRILAGRPAADPDAAPLADAVPGHPYDFRLVPVVYRGEEVVPLRYNGPAMLRGIAAADALAAVPPGGAKPGQDVELLDLPWSLPALCAGTTASADPDGTLDLGAPEDVSRSESSREGARRPLGPRRDPAVDVSRETSADRGSRDPKDVSRETARP
ncbi:molybdopterin-binding protein [Streptomyces sp. NPDC060194]|uniref:molybdopterin-binding protein n=1 Tax=Streptomyces sp. NPDC060194 TaxID=3347069 RepID=UPI003668B975